MFARALLLAGFVLVAAGSAGAATFAASELSYDNALLSQFNLINLGDYSTRSETEGRVLVGGNATFNGSHSVCFNGGCGGNSTIGASSSPGKGVVASSGTSNLGYGAVTVFGAFTGGLTVQNGGDVDIRGSVGAGAFGLGGKGGFNLGGTSQPGTAVDQPTYVRTAQVAPQGYVTNPAPGFTLQTGVAIDTVFPFGSTATANFTTPLTNLAKGIAALPGSPGVTAESLPANQANSPFLAAVDYKVNGKQYGIVTTTLKDFIAQGQNFGGVRNGVGDDATFVIISGDIAGAVLPTLNYTDNKVLYDFVDARSLLVSGGFNGSILAPLASVTQNGVINGSVIVAALNQSQELHQGNLFKGDLSGLVTTTARVPEPASLMLLGAGLVAVVLMRRVSWGPPRRGGGGDHSSNSSTTAVRRSSTRRILPEIVLGRTANSSRLMRL